MRSRWLVFQEICVLKLFEDGRGVNIEVFNHTCICHGEANTMWRELSAVPYKHVFNLVWCTKFNYIIALQINRGHIYSISILEVGNYSEFNWFCLKISKPFIIQNVSFLNHKRFNHKGHRDLYGSLMRAKFVVLVLLGFEVSTLFSIYFYHLFILFIFGLYSGNITNNGKFNVILLSRFGYEKGVYLNLPLPVLSFNKSMVSFITK